MVARSRATTGTGYLGDIPEEVWAVVERAWSRPFSLASNFARENALETAFAASMGWISVITPNGKGVCREWHVTMEGLVALRNA